MCVCVCVYIYIYIYIYIYTYTYIYICCVFVGLDNKLYRMHGTYIKISQYEVHSMLTAISLSQLNIFQLNKALSHQFQAHQLDAWLDIFTQHSWWDVTMCKLVIS